VLLQAENRPDKGGEVIVMCVQNATAGRRHTPNETSHAITNGDQLMGDLTRKEHRLVKIEVNVTTDNLF